MRIKVQPRDIQVLKFVFACRVASYDQILRRHFLRTHKTIAHRRLRKLVNCGFIKNNFIEVKGKIVRVAQPLPKAWQIISEKWPIEVDVPHFKSESLEHDVRMAEIFMRLEKLKCFRSFFTENLLQSSSALAGDPRFRDLAKLQADGALSIEDADGSLRVYGVEYELSKKSPEGYRQKLIDYYLARGIDGVLYISPKREVHLLLTRIDEEIGEGRYPILWFVKEENALAESEKITFTNREGETIDLC